MVERVAKHGLLQIRNILPHEAQWASFAGEYRDRTGKTDVLSNPQAATIRALKMLNTPEEQFEFYCFTYARASINQWSYDNSYKEVRDEFLEMKKKFIMPWSSQAYDLLPLNEWLGDKLFTRAGLNKEGLSKKFREYSNYEFILYDPEPSPKKANHNIDIERLGSNIESLIAYKRAAKLLEKSSIRNPSSVRVNAVILSLGVEKSLKALAIFCDGKLVKKTHGLVDLWESLSSATRKKILAKIPDTVEEIIIALKDNNDAFIEWRYLEEPREKSLIFSNPTTMTKIIDASIQLLQEVTKN